PRHADAVIDTDRLTLAESYVALRDVAEEALNVSRSWREFREDLRSPVLPLPPASVHCLKQ
ncbi:MAG: adenylyl-sulfate kinase, partial [Desulfovibrio sp.]|nr:adenylyl-sulfate kinase [Desulfovibrio sp.]